MNFDVTDRVLTINRGHIKTIINLSTKTININGEILITTGSNNQLKPNQGAMIIK